MIFNQDLRFFDDIYVKYNGNLMNHLEKIKRAKFNIGEVVIHKNQRYKAIVIDIDPIFQASKIYNPLVNKYKFATENLWYRLLVNNSTLETYVKESLLVKDFAKDIIKNPNINQHLKIKNGIYCSIKSRH